MGYACPVCDAPQADGEHLANHLAFTALLGDAAHETYLDDQVPDWGSRDPEGLAAAVVPLAEEIDHEPVSGAVHDHGHAGDHHDERETSSAGSPTGTGTESRVPSTAGADELPRGVGDADGGPGGDETAAIVAEARELTREMYGTGTAAEQSTDGADVESAEDPVDADEDPPTDTGDGA